MPLKGRLVVFRRPRRAILDPLGRAAGVDILVRSEDELRSAVGVISSRGEPGRIVVAGSFAVASSVLLGTGMAGSEISAAGGSVIYAPASAALFPVGSNLPEAVRFSGLRVEGSDGGYAHTVIASANSSASGSVKIHVKDCSVKCTRFVDASSEGLSDSVISDCFVDWDPSSGSTYKINARFGGQNVVISGLLFKRGISSSTHNAIYCEANHFLISGNALARGTIAVFGSASSPWAAAVGTISGNSNVNDISATGAIGGAAPAGGSAIIGNSGEGTITTGTGPHTVIGNAGFATYTVSASGVHDIDPTAGTDQPLNA